MPKQKIINAIEKSYNILSTQEDLSPNNKVINLTLSHLVGDIIETNAQSHLFCDDVWTCPAVSKISPKVREYCQKAEVEMERFWSDYFIKKDCLSAEDMQEFVHYQCYKNIAEQEIEILKRNKVKFDSIAFIGSGPLPMSSILMAKKVKHITNIDYCQKAIEKANALCLRLFDNIKNIKSSAKDYAYYGYDVCFVASMIVGKEELLEELYKQKVEYVIIRDAQKLTQLFYEKLSAGVFKYYDKIDCFDGCSSTLNSSILLKRKS